MGRKSLKSKRQARVQHKISELPDALLARILSFLDTKCAVRTSILSRKWKNVWAASPIVDFRRSEFDKSIDFVNFGNRVLAFHDSTDIEKFRLDCSMYHMECTPHFDGWIDTAIRHNVGELDLCIESCLDQIFELPKSLFICKTLKVLKLRSNYVTNIPESGCFPSLKFLQVTLNYPLTDWMPNLFSNCPALEDLIIEGNRAYGVTLNINVSAPELMRLKVSLRSYQAHNCGGGDTFFISAPKLETLDIEEQGFSNYLLENAKALSNVNIGLLGHASNPDFGDRATVLLARIRHVKCLSLSAPLLEASFLPAFDNLKHLDLVLHECNDWELLIELLKRSPLLEYLVLELDQDSIHGVYLPKHAWNLPNFAPTCLLSHLKTIHLWGFSGHKDEMEAAKYLLKSGEVLNKMTIHTKKIRAEKKQQFCREFHGFERGSKTCQVEFQ